MWCGGCEWFFITYCFLFSYYCFGSSAVLFIIAMFLLVFVKMSFYSSWFLISYCFFSWRIYFFKAGFVLFFLLARSVLLSDDKLNDLQRKFFLHFSTDIACFFSNKHDQKKVKEKNGNLLFCCIGSVFQVSHLGLVDFLIVFQKLISKNQFLVCLVIFCCNAIFINSLGFR